MIGNQRIHLFACSIFAFLLLLVCLNRVETNRALTVSPEIALLNTRIEQLELSNNQLRGALKYSDKKTGVVSPGDASDGRKVR